MLSIQDCGSTRTCEGISRRELLRIGTLGIGGLSLPHLLAARARAAESGSPITDKSVVILFLQGGPTHIETFDPKMTAPVEYRAMFGEVATTVPGVTFGSHFPRLASLADKLAIVRSYRHGIGNHGAASEHVAAGGNPLKTAMGSLYTRVVGATNPVTGIPRNVVITPQAMGEQYKKLSSNVPRVAPLGQLPSAYRVFDPGKGGTLIDNMKLRVGRDRLDNRRQLLGQLDSLKRQFDESPALGGADQFQQQALDVILGGVDKAFDLSQEDPRTIKRYDTGRYKIPRKLQKKKSNVPGQSPVSLGKQMLLARRLVEHGCGFVTVTSAGWDMHGNAFGINDGMPILGSAVDCAAGAFIEDLAERGLTDKVLFVITGEFGRTPKINGKGGRDHWGNLCTLAFSGGGLRLGQVVGSSDRKASVPAGEPVTSQDVLATIMSRLFDIGKLRVTGGVPNNVLNAVTSGRPIKQLV